MLQLEKIYLKEMRSKPCVTVRVSWFLAEGNKILKAYEVDEKRDQLLWSRQLGEEESGDRAGETARVSKLCLVLHNKSLE